MPMIAEQISQAEVNALAQLRMDLGQHQAAAQLNGQEKGPVTVAPGAKGAAAEPAHCEAAAPAPPPVCASCGQRLPAPLPVFRAPQ